MPPQTRKRSSAAKHTSERAAPSNAESSADILSAFALPNGLDASNARMAEQMQAGAVASLDAAQTALSMCRKWLDMSRQLIRAQQDGMFEVWRSQMPASFPAYRNLQTEPDPRLAPELFEAAAKAYGDFGEAVLQAQRDAIETLTHPTH